MSIKGQKKQNKFNKLQVRYSAELPEKLSLINSYWLAAQENLEDNVAFKEIYRLVHNLAGSAGTFGYRTLSEKARELEQLIKPASKLANVSTDARELISKIIKEIESLASQGPDLKKPSEPEIVTAPLIAMAHDETRLIYIVEDDVLLAQELKSRLTQFNYEVSIFSDATEAMTAVQNQLPSAMIVDVELPEGSLAGTGLAFQTKQISEKDIPIIFMSVRNDWNARLEAIRAGGDAYITKPIDSHEILDRLYILSKGEISKPFRILIVEDMLVLAEHYALVLRNANMHVDIVTDPSKLLDALANFKPELILMDIYMPQCSGVEAAKVIRQKEELLSVPIVFLSTEADAEQQHTAMQLGGDDFLQKPISDHRLVSAVSIRANRFRKLRSLMHNDSMTGLLNHVTTKLQLETAIARTIRQKSTLVLAMLDIDNFKSVNDRFGHPMGDRVIKSLARLLSQRLRKSDIIGRYGGEEFAVILPDIAMSSALVLIDDIRKQFNRLTHTHKESLISCSFSAGLANIPTLTDSNSLISAADSALYKAKNSGRNCCVCSKSTEPLSND